VPSPVRVLLAPRSEIHPGLAHFLTNLPSEEVRFFARDYAYLYRFTGIRVEEFDPFLHFSVSETVRYRLTETDRFVVHAALNPVQNAMPWILHTDCFFPLQSHGKLFCIGSIDKVLNAEVPETLVRRRERTMLLHLLDPHCQKILFWTAAGRHDTLGHIASRGLLNEPELQQFCKKIDILYPTLPYKQSITKNECLTVVYAGRNYEHKGGAVALALFDRLAVEFGDRISLLFVGPLPDGLSTAHPQVSFHPLMSQPVFLRLLESAHIFILPTKSENYGMTLLEAANRGLAIVTSGGAGMRHITELFQDEVNAYLVPSELSFQDKVERYYAHLKELLQNQGALVRMQEANRRLFLSGPLGFGDACRKLVSIYRQALRPAERMDSEPISTEHDLATREIDANAMSRLMTQVQARHRTYVSYQACP
jgi:hypothetical protein